MSETSPYRKEKLAELITHLASQFIQENSGPQSLITVTRTDLSSDFKNAKIFVTVLPDDKENQALDFLHRNGSEFKDFVKEKSRLQYIPWFDFEIDRGEKSRQRLDLISEGLKKE